MWLILEDQTGGAISALPLPEGRFLLGRGRDCNLVLQGYRISRHHLLIERSGDEVSFEDLDSTMGVTLNGAQSSSGKLESGDLIGVVNHRLRFQLDLPEVLEGSTGSSPSLQGSSMEKESSDAALPWRSFNALLEKLSHSSNSRELLERLLEGVIDLFSAHRGFVLLKDRNKSKLIPVATVSLDEPQNFIAISSTVYNKALKEGRTVFIRNSLNDKLCQGVQSLSPEEGARSILCGPLSSSGRVFGVIYVDVKEGVGKVEAEGINFFNNVIGLASQLLSGSETRKHLIEAKSRLRTMTTLFPQEDDFVIGTSNASQELLKLIQSAAPLDVSVLITGETGTGKEMVAREIHRNSAVAGGPFVPVNCAALPRDIVEAELFGAEKGAYTGAAELRLGRFELAKGGTLFLDEVGEMPLDVQTSLLRVLQEKKLRRLGGSEELPVSFRLLCATNAKLEEAVREGSFRQDLYYRINVFRIELEPLRNRREDILPLARNFLAYYCKRYGKEIEDFSAQSAELLEKHDWPGNIRELKNAAERAAVIESSNEVRSSSLPIGKDSGSILGMSSEDAIDSILEILPRDYSEARELFERAFLQRCLDESKGNIAAAARNAGMSRCAIYRRLTALGIVEKDGKKK